jgi:AraC-like DNA-binding protein
LSGLAFSSFPVTEVKNLRFSCSRPALHGHPYHQVFVLIKGGGAHSLDGETREVQAPVVLVAPLGRQHLFVPSTQAEGWAIGFTDGLVPSGASLQFLHTVPCAGIPLSRQEVAERLYSLARLIHDNHWDPESEDPVLQSHLLAAYLQILQREFRGRPSREHDLTLADRLLAERFLRLLDQACRCRWEVARYARELRCSRHRLLSICQRTLGQSLRVALEEHRMRRACALLVQDAAGIQQIALELGYPDPSYFTKAFRRVVGVTPTDYRNARLGQRAPGAAGNYQDPDR